MSFHCSVEHFHVEKGHCQDALQQCRAQRPRQCTPSGLPGNSGRALTTHGPQDRQLICCCAVVQNGGGHREHYVSCGRSQPCDQLANGA